jgi:hypothetical protein
VEVLEIADIGTNPNLVLVLAHASIPLPTDAQARGCDSMNAALGTRS